MSVLVIGRTGQVARALAARSPDAAILGRDEADLEHPDTVKDAIFSIRPSVIVNAAAYTAVDAAEDDRDRAFAVNERALGVIGAAARDVGALVVHYSTDYVFDGSGNAPFREVDAPHPLSAYGESKLAGEEALRRSGAFAVILRVSWVYAAKGKNFPLTILRLARERATINVVDDQIGAPTSADLIAATTLRLVPTVLKQPELAGTYHLAPSGETSWHGFARVLVEEALAQGAELALQPGAITAIPSSAYPTKAVRPRNSRLDTSKIRNAFSIDLPPWQNDVRTFVSTLKSGGLL